MLQDVFEIYDGRNSFWQWDTGQKLIVLNDEIDQVHFSNKDMTYAIIKEVYVDSDGTRICDIPDVVLQSSGLLMAYAYVMGNDYNKTICAAKFAVSRRPVPEDYVYEEDDRFLDLVEKIEAIEDLIEGGSKFQKFNSLEEASKWAETANKSGLIITVNVDSKWIAYVVEEGGEIAPVCDPDLNMPMPRYTSVSISSNAWVGDVSPFSQIVTVNGVTKNSKIDPQPSVEQIALLQSSEASLMIENDNGIVTVWSIGEKLYEDMILQVLITEVASI